MVRNNYTVRRFSAWVLLSVFLPTMLVLSLHYHTYSPQNTEICSECVQHKAHAGHISIQHQGIGDCPICQLHGMSYVKPAINTVGALSTVVTCVALASIEKTAYAPAWVVNLRAPPYLV